MSRSSMMRTLKRIAGEHAMADAQGVDVDSVRDRHAALEESGGGLSRRTVLKGAAIAGGAAALGAGILNPAAAGAVPKRPAKVAIVGAGIAGLTAALSLKDQGFTDITVYEANPARIGGRMWTNTSGLWADYQTTEWGGELIDSGHATMRALAKRFGVAEVDILDTQYVDTFSFGGSYYTIAQIEKDYRDVHTAVRRDMASFNWPVTWDGKNNDAAVALSNLTVYDWIETRVPGGHSSKMGQLIDVAYVIEFGADTRSQSSLDLLGLLGFKTQPSKFKVFGASDERYRFVGGNQQIIDAEANELGRDRIQMGWSLDAVRTKSDGTVDLTFNVGGAIRTVNADQVILALPVSIMGDISRAGGFGAGAGFDPRMDATVRAYAMGANNKVQMQFDSRVWHQVLQSSGSTYSDTGYQTTWETTSKQPGASGIITQYAGGTPALQQAAMVSTAFASTDAGDPSRSQVQAVVRQVLSQMEPVLPGLSAKWNGRATVSMWSSNPYTKGAYAYYAPGYPHQYSGYEGVSQGNVHFAGEYVSIDFQGYMEGGAVTGLQAAKKVVALAK